MNDFLLGALPLILVVGAGLLVCYFIDSRWK